MLRFWLVLSFYFFFSTFFSLATAAPQSQYLESYELVRTISIETIDSFRRAQKVPKSLFPVRYAVKVYEILYHSKHIDGSSIRASGLYFMPVAANKEVPLLSYHHGTQIKKEREIGFWREQNFCIGFATGGFAVVEADYHGLGKGEGRHLYCHSESESEAVLNMLRAVQELNKLEGHEEVSNKLFLTGYSQGGHATLAVQKAIQEKYSDEFDVIASAPMSGPYDLSGIQAQVMNRPYSHPSYLPYLLYGYQEAYNLAEDVNDIFVEPYKTTLPELYEGKYTLAHINTLLPEIPEDMVEPIFLDDYKNNPNSKLILALKENDIYDWKPEKPIQFCYCKSDQQVDYRNTKIAMETMQKNGAKLLRKRNASNSLNHVPCAYVSVVYTKLYFNSFYKKIIKGKNLPKNGHKGDWGSRVLIDIAKSFSGKEKG